MSLLYQDAMALVRAHVNPDVFITMTCNPTGPENSNELKTNEVANCRPDLVARVFGLTLKSRLHKFKPIKRSVLSGQWFTWWNGRSVVYLLLTFCTMSGAFVHE
jgi:hypothetical protein